MAIKNRALVRKHINQIITYAKAQSLGKDSELFEKFIRFYYAYTSARALGRHSVEGLFGAALSHWELMKSRKPGTPKIQVFNPSLKKEGWECGRTIIQVVVDDMPFLIDSLRNELGRMGLHTHQIVHTGGLKVLRGAKGQIQDILPHDTRKKDVVGEAPIEFEIDLQDSKKLPEIKAALSTILNDVALSVHDWQAMRERMKVMIGELNESCLEGKESEIQESIAFLEWLLHNHFTFLGSRDYVVVEKNGERALQLVPGSGLGVLTDASNSKLYRQFSDLPQKVRDIMLSPEQILLISKTNTKSTVHRDAYTDYIGVKRFNDAGELVGERRFIGLYTSQAYNSNPEAIPFLRHKVSKTLKKSGLPRKSHGGKDLIYILSSLPRDDLFQASIDELYELVMGILHLHERHETRLFVRRDIYGRFMSCLVYIPRENYRTDLLAEIQELLQTTFSGEEVNYSLHLSESVLVRVHYVVRVDPKEEVTFDQKALEEKVILLGKSWQDRLRESAVAQFGEEAGNKYYKKYQRAFPAGYREAFEADAAIRDIEFFEKLSSDTLEMNFYRPKDEPANVIRFKVFRLGETVPLSDALPMLENMGLRVVGEQPYRVRLPEGKLAWINDFSMTYPEKGPAFVVKEVKALFQDAFQNIWAGNAENDILNKLVLTAKLNWHEIAMLRGYTKYLLQIRFTFSPQYIMETLVHNPEIAKRLVGYFHMCFDPKKTPDRATKVKAIEAELLKKLDNVASLDEDRILRRFISIINATIRTNYYQTTAHGKPKSYISYKIDPSEVPDMPKPVPCFGVFVYSPRFEGIHLRAGRVARGGIRWSDRKEDFRTEVLGLMKAQRVKNAVIVPAGAKGGFVPKNLPVNGTRDEILEEGIACYKGFINGLLDITDNLKGTEVIPPKKTYCYDESDPYLVVAADKGTAAFSDIANGIAKEHDFWLGDAFASGGSNGYDHKKMGITARGAWVSVQRQFQELDINVDNTEITVVGIGDMAGDVFGNGMLMSKHIKLVAAFNHMHIFIDPNPDCAESYKERKRLFDLPRSSWTDYDKKLISRGGGVFRRSEKSIKITRQMKKVFCIEADSLTPNELISALLCAPVDLLWNGGIGTYVKAETETHEDVGDRNNDALRVNGRDLRARVVAEGGNLGLTQLGRIEYELNGGYINTDFIDNSAGVDCSDHEVNVKILLNHVVESGKLTEAQRDKLLVKMTDEVGDLVLKDNYHQNEALSLAAHTNLENLSLYINYLDAMEAEGKINRAIEFLPETKTLLERKSMGKGFTRPELAVLFSYSKIILEEQIRRSELPKDPYLARYVEKAFPTPVRKPYATELEEHRLRDEILATQVSNRLVSDMGIAFTYQMHDETGAPVSAIVRAYAAVADIFHLIDIEDRIDALDYKVNASVQHGMRDEIVRLVRRSARWVLRNRRDHIDIQDTIDYFAKDVSGLYKRLPTLLIGDDKLRMEQHRDSLIEANVPEDLATVIASTTAMFHSLNIIEASKNYDVDVYRVATIYFTLVDHLDLLWFRDQINAYPVDSKWSILAKSSMKGDLDWIQRELIFGVLNMTLQSQKISSRMNAWYEKHHGLIERWQNIIMDMRALGTIEFEILSVAVRELFDLAQTSAQYHSDKE